LSLKPITLLATRVTAFYKERGRDVVSEERGGTADYGTLDAEYIDPIDGTRNFVNNRVGIDRQSLAAFSLGSVTTGRVARGVVNFPLLRRPRLYWAEEGQGAFRVLEKNGSEARLEVDPTMTSGVVGVSENTHQYVDRLALHTGLTVVRLSGAVFKACSVADPTLVSDFDPALMLPGEQVIGFISTSAQPHDYLAAERIVEEAGGEACGLDGGPLPLGAGKHGCVFANSERTRDLLLEALNG
jgi:fructose-1,6-bisphosphatase/inositol monophosphatase family enzyme